eukprot:scaffold713_cov114-Isochrysis_galbana.AAC.11
MTLEVGTSSRELILTPYRSCTSCPQTEDLSSAMLSGYPLWMMAVGVERPYTSTSQSQRGHTPRRHMWRLW